MKPEKLEAEFRKREPWVTKFIIDGKVYGGNFNALEDIRLDWFFEYFPDVETILELGSLEGGHTFRLATHSPVKRILGIEGRQSNVDKARFVQQELGINKVEFIKANLEEVNLSSFGKFDVVLCIGVLYHLPKPWELIRQMSRIADKNYIWTHYADLDMANTVVDGYEGLWYNELGQDDPLSGLSSRSFWPTLDALIAMLKDEGFKKVHIIENSNYPEGYPVPEDMFIDLVVTKD